MAFTPKSKTSFKETIKIHFLNGDVLRADFRDETPIEVMDRKHALNLSSMSNICQEGDKVSRKIFCDHHILHEVMDELRKDYSVREVRCQCSGCCQYATYGYYLD
jgi:hypothetical protein